MVVALWCVVVLWVVLCGRGCCVVVVWLWCGGIVWWGCVCVWWPCDVVWVVWKGVWCGGAVCVWWCWCVVVSCFLVVMVCVVQRCVLWKRGGVSW